MNQIFFFASLTVPISLGFFWKKAKLPETVILTFPAPGKFILLLLLLLLLLPQPIVIVIVILRSHKNKIFKGLESMSRSRVKIPLPWQTYLPQASSSCTNSMSDPTWSLRCKPGHRGQHRKKRSWRRCSRERSAWFLDLKPRNMNKSWKSWRWQRWRRGTTRPTWPGLQGPHW